MKERNCIIISIDEKKSIRKTLIPFQINTMNKLGTKGKSLNMLKGIHEKLTANIVLKGEKNDRKLFP